MALKLEDYKVGWITALPIEAAAAKAMLDTVHDRLPTPDQDSNIYTFGHSNSGNSGSNGGHNVVIASGRPGTTTAASVANDMRRTFSWLRIGLMVGIAGGVWHPDTDVRLGDIVVGVHPRGEAGVVQYDYGKQVQDQAFIKTSAMNKAPAILLNAAAAVQADHLGLDAPEMAYVAHLERDKAKKFSKRPAQDRLFNATYLHENGLCDDCNKQQLRERPVREYPAIPKVHYGPIASGNRVIRDAIFAETIRETYGNLCFEMEAAGLDNFPSLTIRGISDYCDTHKNDDWHQYAAVAAAAYAKELLSVVPPTAVVQLPQLGNTYWNVPRAPNSLFTGRQHLLDSMRNHLITKPEKKDRPLFVLQGIGGAGKSETAIQFATANQDSFWGIFWIDADNRQSIEQGFAEVARLQVPPLQDTTPRDVTKWLATTKESWLLILDNCDDAELDYAKYIPSRGGSTIITTRLVECRIHGTWKNIDELGFEDAVQLLFKASGLEDDDLQALISVAQSIVSVLGQHALALVHAGAYIKKGYCTLNEYVRYFRDEQNRLMKFKPEQQASRYGSVYTTFEVSAKALASSDRHDGHLALRLLNILAFLDREAVEVDLFIRAFDECRSLENIRGIVWEENGAHSFQDCAGPSTRNDPIARDHNASEDFDSPGSLTTVLCGWGGGYKFAAETEILESGPEDDGEIYRLGIWHCNKVRSSGFVEHQQNTRFRAACIRLAELSLIRFDNNIMSLHPLIHEWSRNRLGAVARQEAWEQTLSILALVMDNVDRKPLSLRLVSHLDTCVRGLGEERGQLRLSLQVAQALYRLAWFYYKQYRWGASLAIFETLSVAYEVQPHTWSYRNNLLLRAKARCLGSLGRPLDMHSCVKQILQITARRFEPDSFEAYTSQALLADTYDAAGNFRIAADLYESLYKRNSQTCVLRDKNLSKILTGLIQAHTRLGNNERAVTLLIEELQIYWRVYSPDHPFLLRDLAALAHLYIIEGAAGKVVTMLEGEVNSILKRCPRDHLWTSLMSDLARAYEEVGRYDQATPILEEMYSDCTKKYSAEYPVRVDTLYRLARVYCKLEKPHHIINLTEEMSKINLSSLSRDDSRRTLSMTKLAEIYLQLDKPSEAAKLLEEVVKIDALSLPVDHPERLSSMDRLAEAYLQLDKPSEAATLLQEVVRIEALSLPLDNPERLSSMNRLAQTYLRLDKSSHAVSLLEEVVEIEASSLPLNDPGRLISMDTLAEAYIEFGRSDQAIPLLEEVVTLESGHLANDDPSRLRSVRRLALAYTNFGTSRKVNDIVSLLEEVMNKGRETLHVDPAQLRHTQKLLAYAQEKLRQTTQQQPLVGSEEVQHLLDDIEKEQGIPDVALNTLQESTIYQCFHTITRGVALMF